MRLPPPWATLPAALSSSRLLSGAAGNDAPAAGFLDQGGVIELRLEAEQRQLEAVLAARLAVAAAGVAAELGEDRHDLVAEVDRQVDVAVCRRDRDRDASCRRRSAGDRWSAPLATGTTRPALVTRTTLASATSYLTSPVRSWSRPPARPAVRINCWASSPFEGDLFGLDGEGLDFGGLGQDHRLQLGPLLVGVDVSGRQEPGRPGEGRGGKQSGPAKACHEVVTPQKWREASGRNSGSNAHCHRPRLGMQPFPGVRGDISESAAITDGWKRTCGTPGDEDSCAHPA